MKKIKSLLVAILIATTVVSCSSDDSSAPEKKQFTADFEYVITYDAPSDQLLNWNESLGIQFNGKEARIENESEYENEMKKDNFYLYKGYSKPVMKKSIVIRAAETATVSLTIAPEEVMEIGRDINLTVKLLRNEKFVREMKAKVSYTTATTLTFAEGVE